MKRRKSNWAILGIVVLLGIGYLIPTIVMQLKDWSLNNTQKEIEIEAIQLESQKVDLMEELSAFPEMIANQLIVEMGDSFVRSYEDSFQQTEGSVAEELYTSVQAFLTMLDAKEEVVLEKFYAQNYAMMVDTREENVYSIWVCEGEDGSGNVYYFWVDATLNKVMAFDVPFAIFGKGEEAFYSAMDRVIEYYDFAAYDSLVYCYESSNIEEMVKLKYAQDHLLILDKSLKETLSLCIYKNMDRFLFNVYPGGTSMIYDAK